MKLTNQSGVKERKAKEVPDGFGLRDSNIRAALRQRLLSHHASENNTVVLEELGLCRGRVRADVAVVNGLIHGYEIKSDRDDFRRLRTQIDIYSRVLDRATLVVGDRLLAEAIDSLPQWWGLLHARCSSGHVRFKTLRRARQNLDRDPRALVELLWLQDAMALLRERNASRGVCGKPRRVVWDRVCDSFEIEEIARAVRARLKARSTIQAPA
jgi:hypothetical protein